MVPTRTAAYVFCESMFRSTLCGTLRRFTICLASMLALLQGTVVAVLSISVR